MRSRFAVALLTGTLLSPTAFADVAVSANDAKMKLVNGVSTVIENPGPDTVAVIDLSKSPPVLIAEIEVPTSLVGPPFSVAVAPDESFALVTAAMKIDPANPGKQIPDNRLSVIDLQVSPPAVIATLEAGKGAAGVSINALGTLALVANRAEGTVSVYTIEGKTVKPAGTVILGDEKTGVSHPAITPDGKMALVTRDGDDKISVLAIDGANVTHTKRDISAGKRPYGLDISTKGDIAVVANIGTGSGDTDTVSLIDVQAKPPRVVDTISVCQTPEGIRLSPDGRNVAVVCIDGSNKPKESPFFKDAGKLVLLRVEGKKLSYIADAPIGHWSQGAAWSADGKTVLAQNVVERTIQVFRVNGDTLKDTGQPIALKAGAAGIRTADKVR